MRAAPHEYRRRALKCAERAASCASPSLRQKFADLANVWLMLAVQLEEYAERGASFPGSGRGRGADMRLKRYRSGPVPR